MEQIKFVIILPDHSERTVYKPEDVIICEMHNMMQFIYEQCQRSDEEYLKYTYEGIPYLFPNPKSIDDFMAKSYKFLHYVHHFINYEQKEENFLEFIPDDGDLLPIYCTYAELFAPIIQKQTIALSKRSINDVYEYMLSDYMFGIFIDFLSEPITQVYENNRAPPNFDDNFSIYLVHRYRGSVTKFHRLYIIELFIGGVLDLIADYSVLIPSLIDRNLDSPDIFNIALIKSEVTLEQFIRLAQHIKENYPNSKIGLFEHDLAQDFSININLPLQRQKIFVLYQYDLLNERVLNNNKNINNHMNILNFIASIERKHSLLFQQLKEKWLYDPIILRRVIEFIINPDEDVEGEDQANEDNEDGGGGGSDQGGDEDYGGGERLDLDDGTVALDD